MDETATKTEEKKLPEKRLFVALFSYKSAPDILTKRCLEEALLSCSRAGMGWMPREYYGDGIIPRVRNAALTEFKETNCTHIVMIDDDVAWQPELIPILVNCDEDVVGAMYPARHDPEQYVFRWPDGKKTQVNEKGLLHLETIPAGCMVLSRKCVEKMLEHYKDDWYHDDILSKPTVELFEFERLHRRLWGEDFAFCRKWNEIGGKCYVYPNVHMTHVGRKEFHGHFGNWLEKNGQPTVAVAGPEVLGKRLENFSNKINVCIPTRGKPRILDEFVMESLRYSRLASTKFVIGFDEDDPTVGESKLEGESVIRNIVPRTDSLGEKYNVCAEAYDADLYVMGLDDVAIAMPGWDEILHGAASRIPFGIGVIYFGKEPHGESLPSMMAVTKRFMQIVGYFCPPVFPFWWNNTWINEIAVSAGVVTHLDNFTMKYPQNFDKPLRRDIMFWAETFDAMRPLRHKAVERIRTFIQAQLDQYFEFQNSCLRDPQFTSRLEKESSTEDVEDERHLRLKARAKKVLAAIEKERQEGKILPKIEKLPVAYDPPGKLVDTGQRSFL